jgi:hypothetical protein
MIYARLNTDPVRASVSAATSAMLEGAGVMNSANVMPLKRVTLSPESFQIKDVFERVQ